MAKTVRARYSLEFKQEAVRLVAGGQSVAAVARSLGLVDQTLFNWVKAERLGQLKGVDAKVVRYVFSPPAQMVRQVSKCWSDPDSLTGRQPVGHAIRLGGAVLSIHAATALCR